MDFHPPLRVVVSLKIEKGNFSDLSNKIIPFFDKYPLFGVKFLNYQDWCKIAELISQGAHLTAEGLEKIKLIKLGMNTVRKM